MTGVEPASVHIFKHEYLRNQRAGHNEIRSIIGVGGKPALGFWPDRTLVSMATASSHRVIMRKTVLSLFLRYFFIRSFSYLQVTMICMRARRSLKFCAIRPPTAVLAAI